MQEASHTPSEHRALESSAAFRPQTILLATDFSTAAEKAQEVALVLASEYGALLLIAHSAVPEVPSLGLETVLREAVAAGLHSIHQRIDAELRSQPGFAGIRHKLVVSYQSPCDLTLRLAAEAHADLIVIGAGERGLRQLFIGSVAERLAADALCPLLIVGPRAAHVESLFTSILCATDLRDTGILTAAHAIVLCSSHKSRLTMAHVLERSHKMQPSHRQRVEAMSLLKLLVPPELHRGCDVSLKVEFGDRAATLLKLLKETHASLLIIGRGEQRSLADRVWWDLLSSLLKTASCPVLVIPPVP